MSKDERSYDENIPIKTTSRTKTPYIYTPCDKDRRFFSNSKHKHKNCIYNDMNKMKSKIQNVYLIV